MKKTLLATALATQMFTQLYAGGNIEPLKPTIVNETEIIETKPAESKFYIVIKGMNILGEKVDHGLKLLDGGKGYGYGVDLGYRIGNGFSVEYDFSYSSNTVTEGTNKETGKYYTSALDLVYTYEISEGFGLFGKAGYEYEWEKINGYGIDSRNNNFVFGAGAEIAINETYKFVAEYEHSLIKGPRGDGILLGLMINF